MLISVFLFFKMFLIVVKHNIKQHFSHYEACSLFDVFVFLSLSHVRLCNPIDCSTPGLPVLHYLLEFAQTHVHWVDNAIQVYWHKYMSLSICNHHHCPSPGFSWSQTESLYPLNNNSPFPQPQPVLISNLLSVFVNLPILHISGN